MPAPLNATQEIEFRAMSGGPMLTLVIVLLALVPFLIYEGAHAGDEWLGASSLAPFLVALLLCRGFFTVPPNTARVLLLFGRYKGTARESGFHFANPFLAKKRLSLRAHNLTGQKLHANDTASNPIEIAA